MRRLLLTVAGLVGFASMAGAYTHFIHYTTHVAPFNPAPEKFDLAVVPNKTLTFLVADSTAVRISKSELYPSVLSSIREAARVWNGVETSDLRIAFGGIATADVAQSSPGVDIVFEEMDPLLLGLTSTNAQNSLSASGLFVPITRPVVRLNRDLSIWTTASSGPSFTEAFFLTVVHEMGHALGLQHTFTASTMSTEITRATTLAAPLTSDDIAGVSYLYPARTFGQATGSISGRVTFPNGQGVHMASVVAIRPVGGAISAMTDRDGRYRIDGVLPGSYVLYAHPLPPARRVGVPPGDVALPIDPDGRQVAGDGPFDTLFYQGPGSAGTRDFRQAQSIVVTAGVHAENISLTPNRRSSYGPITAVTTYSYFDQTPVRPAYLNTTGTLLAGGAGLLTSGGAITPGLEVNFLGGTPVLRANGAMAAYSGYLVLYLHLPSTFGGLGPRAIVFTTPDDVYVLPSGLNLAQQRPPFISSVTAVTESSGARALAIEGTTLGSDTKFYFDSVPGSLLRFDEANRAIVALPPGLTGMPAAVTAFNADGQNSMFLQAAAAPAFAFESGEAGFVSLAPNTLAAGSESLVEITGGGGTFVEGITTVGFGSTDVQVRRMWVVGPNRILANVWVAANAAALPVTASVVTGFQVISQPLALQIAPVNSKAPVLSSQLVNAAPPIEGIFPGATVMVSGANLTGGTLTVNDRNVLLISVGGNQITFIIPADLPPGLAILKYSNGVDSASVAIVIGAPMPEIRTVAAAASDLAIDTNHPVRVGDTITLLIGSLTDAGTTPRFSRIRVTIGGVDVPVQGVTPLLQGHKVQVAVAATVPIGLQPVIVSIDGRTSLPFSLLVNP